MSKIITSVRYSGEDQRGYRHITRVHLAGGSDETKSEVLSGLANGASYKTRATNGREADVESFKADGSNYLRTDRNETKTDNLGKLPEY